MKISEIEFSSTIEDLLNIYKWRWCHFRTARTKDSWRTALSGDKGFPDYIAVRPPRLLIAELKSEDGKLTDDQQLWLDALRECVRMITLEPVISSVITLEPVAMSPLGHPINRIAK